MEENEKIKCPKCGRQLPIFSEDGKHNFCPTSVSNGQIIDVCMECKMEEIFKKWKTT